MKTLKEELLQARREFFIRAAMKVAEQKGGFHRLTREMIAKEAGVSPPLVSRYLGGMDTIRSTIMTEAVAQSRTAIVAQGLTAGHPVALAASETIKQKAKQSIR